MGLRDGLPILEDCPSWFAGTIEARLNLGDHVGFLLAPSKAQYAQGDEILFFGVIPMRVMTLVMVLGAVNLLQGITYAGSGVAHFAHLGGFLFAFIFMRAPGLLGLDRARQQVADLPDEDARPRAIQRPLRPRERAEEVDDVVARSRAALSEVTTRIAGPRRAPASADPQSEVDRVLDKISASGLDSLSRQERAVLDAYSERLKQGR